MLEPRDGHHHDPGGHLHQSVWLLQRQDGPTAEVDHDEPRRVAESIALMGLGHVVITCVDRDDLPDGGAAIWAETIERVHEACPDTSVECLIGDHQGRTMSWTRSSPPNRKF